MQEGYKDNILYFDIETTDLPVNTARIVTISFIFNGEEKTLYINPTVHIEIGASRVNGIYDKDIKEWKTFNYYAPKIFELLNKCEGYGGYNNRTFDIPILAMEMLRCGYEIPIKPIYDVYEMVQGLFRSLKLKDIYTTLTKKTFEAHKSESDIKATLELYNIIKNDYLNG